MRVLYDNEFWITDDINIRTAVELRQSFPNKKIKITSERGGKKKEVFLGEVHFEWE